MAEEKPKTIEELMRVLKVENIDLPDGDVGEGLRFETSRGDFRGILHRSTGADKAVI